MVKPIKMSQILTTKNFIGNEHFTDFLEYNSNPETNYFHLLNAENVLVKKNLHVLIVIDLQIYLLFNTCDNCFSQEPITPEENYLIESVESINALQSIYNERGIGPVKRIDFLNKCLEEKTVTTLKCKEKNGRYVVSEKDYDLRILMLIEVKNQYFLLPKLILHPNIKKGTYFMISPVVLYPMIYRLIDPYLCKKLDTYLTDNIFDFQVLLKMIECCQNIGLGVFLNIGTPTREQILKDLNNFRKCYEHQHIKFMKLREMREDKHFSFRDNGFFFNYGNKHYQMIQNEIVKGKCLISFCDCMNPESGENTFSSIIDVIPNIHFKLNKNNLFIACQSRNARISEEEASKNAELLLADEEKEIQKKKSKKNKKKKDNHIIKLKETAKKIAQEALKQFERFNNIRKKRNAILEWKIKKARQLAEEAIEYIQEKKSNYLKEIPLLDDNSHCYIGSDEHLRRMREWDLTEIIPDIYCLPKEFLISLFAQKQSESLWLFDLK